MRCSDALNVHVDAIVVGDLDDVLYRNYGYTTNCTSTGGWSFIWNSP